VPRACRNPKDRRDSQASSASMFPIIAAIAELLNYLRGDSKILLKRSPQAPQVSSTGHAKAG
jgi:hypothetical protein